MFVSLPTGFGKTLCFGVLPWTFDHLRGSREANPATQRSIVLVVSPLVALMDDQLSFFVERGLTATRLRTGMDCNENKGQFQLVFASPEMLLCNRQCRDMLRSELYRTNLVGVAIDEAHCVKKW